MQIYTFWEPRDRMPYYIQLCIETWKKFLPEAEITILDFSNVKNQKLYSQAFKKGVNM